MKLKNGSLILLLGVLVCSCTTEVKQPKVDPNVSALPHSAALPKEELSQEDKKQLALANGLKSEPINTTDLSNMLQNAKDKLFVFAFWKMDCEDCIQNLINLKSLNVDESNMKIVSINLDGAQNESEISFFLRSKNIPFASYVLKYSDDSWKKVFDPNWKDELPSIFLINQAEDVLLKYYKLLSKNELEAITAALII